MERFDFSDGEENSEISAVPLDVAFPERARNSIWPTESITLLCPEK